MIILLLFMFRASKRKIYFLFNNFKLKLNYFEVLNILITQFFISISSFAIFIGSIYLLNSTSAPSIINNNQFNHFQFLVYFLLVVMTAPILEELLFRVILFKRVAFYCGTTIAVILSSLIFGILHTKLAIISAISFSIMNSILYFKYNNILLPMFIHFINNLFSVLLELLVPSNISIYMSTPTALYLLVLGLILFIFGLFLFIKYILQNKHCLNYKFQTKK
ncbi:MAG: lysostaphin resistance A-like protein [Peptostreptococcaceae bacterium]